MPTAKWCRLSTLIDTHTTLGPETLNRYNLFNSVTINAMSGARLQRIPCHRAPCKRISAEQLPQGYRL